MTGAEFIVTYAICWWLVLFMVLPHKADAPANPGLGHAPSAPEKPQLKRKMLLTTGIAFIPAIAVYFLIGSAYAADTVYRAGSGCKKLGAYVPSADLNATEGKGTGDTTVKPATLDGGKTILGDKGEFEIPLRIPAQNYVDPAKHNVDLSQSFVRTGDVTVSKDGSVKLNGEPVAQQDQYSDGCEETSEAPQKSVLKTDGGSDSMLTTKKAK